jgi:hypothetical protein
MKSLVRTGTLFGVLLLGGCAAIPMQEAKLVMAAPPDKAIVTFIRPVIMIGEAMNVYLWDGDRFIGVLGSGDMVQYEATPGEHLFLGRSENWTYASGSLEAGKRYLIKTNMFPGFAMRAAFASMPATDVRLSDWYAKMPPKAAAEADRAKYEASKVADARQAIANFKDGKVKSFAQILPGDGH